MNKERKFFFALLLTLIFIVLTESDVEAAPDIPFYDNTSNTFILDLEHSLFDYELFRVNQTVKHWPDGRTLWMGPRRYPTIYEGHPDDGGRLSPLNTTFTAQGKYGNESIYAYYYGFVHLAGPLKGPIPGTAFNVTPTNLMVSHIVQNVFGGNASYVLGSTPQYPLVNKNNNNINYGDYFWIRDLAYFSGGAADNDPGMTLAGKNNTFLRIYKTAPPDISTFRVKEESLKEAGKPVYVEFDGFEYVSQGRKQLRWSMDVKFNGSIQESFIEGTTSTKGAINPNKAHLKHDSGKFSKNVSFTPKEVGTYTLELKVTDQVQRTSETKTLTVVVGEPTGTAPPILPEPEPEPNIPPVANLFMEREYYWVEQIHPQDNSYDVDGEIVSRDYQLDGHSSGTTLKFSRVTAPEPHSFSVTVTDDRGDSDTAMRNFTILPTTPVADFTSYSYDRNNNKVFMTGKVNRLIEVDATLSDAVTKSRFVAPINYALTTYEIIPKTDGVTKEDIKMREASDKSHLQFLVRKPGTYDIKVTVTNQFGETSNPVTKTIQVVPDDPPEARFSVDKKKVLRDGATKKAAVVLTDDSRSYDDDVIKKRIWYVEYDSDNDGVFGTPRDAPKQIISNQNEKTVTYQSDRVGNYRFSLEVVEDFGQPTLKEFIRQEHYLADVTDVINQQGTVAEYHLPENFNVPGKDVAVTIDNAPPIVDFGMQRHAKVDLVLNFGGLDTATRQHLTGNAPGGGSYDHYYYTYDTAEKNRLTSLAADLEMNLREKGIDAQVTVNNSYYYRNDTDGTCTRNVPVWGWTYWTTTETNTVTTTSSYYSPPSGWSITNSSSRDVQKWAPVWCDNGFSSHEPPCLFESNAIYGWVYSHTEYTYTISKTTEHSKYEIQYYTDYGCSSTEQVNTTNFTEAFANTSYRNEAEPVYIRFDKRNWDWVGRTTDKNRIINAMKNKAVFLWNTANSGNRNNLNTIVSSSSKKGQFTVYDSTAPNKHIQEIEDFLVNKYMLIQDGEHLTILLGDKIDYTVTYEDFENDPELKREWKFAHDPTKVNGREIDNQPSNPIAQNELWVNSPLQLPEVGTYKIQLRSMDNPIYWNDDRFFNYRKWSDQELVREYTVSVHRKPVPEFTFTIDRNNQYALNIDASDSYDPDHQFNREDKGIVKYEWHYYLDGQKYDGMPPATIQPGKFYDTTLTVTDIDGAVASITKRITTGNLPPVAKFSVQDVVLVNTPLNFVDSSYDPNGDPIKIHEITIRRQGGSTILQRMTNWPSDFQSMGLGAGEYVIGLVVVEDTPTALRSELYEQNIKVVSNNPPVSRFTLTPNPIEEGKYLTYQDSSYDPDGHPLINYSWKIEYLDEHGIPLQTWITGVPPTDLRDFRGIGTYRITQTVFDDPPFPLPSLSGSSTVYVEMIPGPKPPYPEFTWFPKELYDGETFTLDPSLSYDLDGEVVAYEWSWTFKAPGQTVPSSSKYSNLRNPAILGQEGEYVVSLHVRDNDGLRSLVPAVHTIVVGPKRPNLPPVAEFSWNPYEPLLGKEADFNPDASYDEDGTIVSWYWEFRDQSGKVTTSNKRYPTIVAASPQYQVTLRVTDDRGAIGTNTKTMNVNIAALDSLVTHVPSWKEKWVKDGYDPDVNLFWAGEKFVIELTSTPANRVWGSVHFGGDVGYVEIPSSSFTLVSTSPFEYKWRAELWQSNFVRIKKGQYLFQFHSAHPVLNPYVEAEDSYMIEIVGNVYDAMNFHRNF